ncbi:hypothetical protein DMH02_020885 [Streptomyces sp. WAC 00631]|uniref:hypothetical protein n=1 Tax=Streptomyces sp. WAC 00631 TaxID=2203201 RepID=UPI00163CAF8B|nr:hypothetical protein [Streptomyces sp. WAC 00631]MCC5035600.1 hypothetical protein [Streptomyces sp. WAC 00631]
MAEHPAVTAAAAPAAGAGRPASHRHPGMGEDRRGKPAREFRNTAVTAGDAPRDRRR